MMATLLHGFRFFEITLSRGLRDAIPMMALLNKALILGILITFRCTVFEENAGCVEFATSPKCVLRLERRFWRS